MAAVEKSKREAKSGEERVLFLYSGQNLVATLKVAADGAARAFDPAGKYLGKFPSVKAASAAISTPDAIDRQQNRAARRRQRDKIKKSAAARVKSSAWVLF